MANVRPEASIRLESLVVVVVAVEVVIQEDAGKEATMEIEASNLTTASTDPTETSPGKQANDTGSE